MKRIAMLHTVKSVYESFPQELRAALSELNEEVKFHNILDDFLADDPADTGKFSKTNKLRLLSDLQVMQMTGADLIVVTCSTLSPAVAELRPLMQTRIVTIDEAMMKKAVLTAEKIGLLATACSTIGPSQFKLAEEAEKVGRRLQVETIHDEEAVRSLKRGDRIRHDEIVLKMGRKLHDPELVVLAQASMAHMKEPLASELGVPVLASPELCIQQIREILTSEAEG